MAGARKQTPAAGWSRYYHWTAQRPPRELLIRTLDHIGWEKQGNRGRTAIDLGYGSGTDTLELLRRGWSVVAVDAQATAARFLARRVPASLAKQLSCFVSPMEDFEFPPADLVYASFSLPFCPPGRFPAVWARIRDSLRPGGHFAGQLFGTGDAWNGDRPMSFHSRRQILGLARGYRVELLRESVEEGLSFRSAKHWHFYDLVLGKPPVRSHVLRWQPR